MEALTIIFDGVIIFQRTLYESQFELLKVNWLSFSILSILSRIHLSIIIFRWTIDECIISFSDTSNGLKRKKNQIAFTTSKASSC